MRTKNLPPFAPTLIESTRAIGYSLEAAVADIVDNCIAASASSIKISFFPIDGAYVSILDNGTGMNETELDSAMQYGSKSPIDVREAKDLGRFGLGLKTASLSQCRALTVVSKQGASIQGRRWDIDHVAEVGDWSLLVLEQDELKDVPEIDKLLEQQSGTLVVWQKLDRMQSGEINFELALGRKIDNVRAHLALVYHRYLSGEPGIVKFKLSINDEPVLPADPFLKDKSTRPMDDEVLIIRGEKIVVRPFILPHISRMTSAEIQELGGTVGPRYKAGNPMCERWLHACYWNSLELAKQHDLHTVAFPAISTGVYGYPKQEAAKVALLSVANWLQANPDYGMAVIMVCRNEEAKQYYQNVIDACAPGRE